jgi:hypothetical protein
MRGFSIAGISRVDLAVQMLPEVHEQPSKIHHASTGLQLYQEIDVARSISIAAHDRAKYPEVACTVASSDRQDHLAPGFEFVKRHLFRLVIRVSFSVTSAKLSNSRRTAFSARSACSQASSRLIQALSTTIATAISAPWFSACEKCSFRRILVA